MIILFLQLQKEIKISLLKKLYHLEDITGFFNVVNRCKGRIELITNEGDRLNLKSKLSRYIALANLFNDGGEIPEMEIMCSDPDDVKEIMKFIAQAK